MKSNHCLFVDKSFYRPSNSQLFWKKKRHVLLSTFCNQRNLRYVLNIKVLFDKCHILSKHNYMIYL